MLEQAEQWLKRKCYRPRGPYLRPFAPNPQWKRSTVFIVGLNPSTPFRNEFESYEQYWDSLTANPESYHAAYYNKYRRKEEERSRTSKTIVELVNRLKPLNVLVTNVYAYPTPNPKLIPKAIKEEPLSERIIARLILTCKPKAILFHGREARQFANKYFGVELNPYLEPLKQSTTVYIKDADTPSLLLGYHHFVGRVHKHNIVHEHLKQLAARVHLGVLSA